MRTDQDTRATRRAASVGAGAGVTAPSPACTSRPVGSYGASGVATLEGSDVARWPGEPGVDIAVWRLETAASAAPLSASDRPSVARTANGRGADAMPRRTLDAESRSWWQRLHAPEPIRGWAIAELYERLRREAAFHVRQRAASLARFPRSDIDDVATQAAGDALVVLLRKLEDYRGDSQFLTWARRFAALEAPVSIRRRLGRDRVRISDDPERVVDVADLGESAHDRAEAHELLKSVGRVLRDELTPRQRTVLTEVAINGTSTGALAEQLETTPGAIYKSLHDARLKVRRLTAQLEPVG